MKNMRKLLSVLLALVMVLSLVACGGNGGKETSKPAAGNDDPVETTVAPATTSGEDMSWLNLGGVSPIVAEGVEKTLTLCIPINDEVIDTYKERWQYIVVTEIMNINLEVQAVPSSAWSEKRPLIMADTENLPDLIMNAGFTIADMLRYGADEGLLVNIAPYINENFMPCLTSLFADHPEYKIPWTDAEGRVWGVGCINHIDRSDEMQWHYLNYKWMEDCGLDVVEDMPKTLDEFTDLMRLFKEKKSAEFGEEIYPISGKFTGWNSIYRYLLAACGFVGSNRTDSYPGSGVNMKDGEVTIPYMDRTGGWKLFVETMKLWYDEGLVHPEYFTGESSAIEALVSAGKTGFTTVPPFIWVGNTAERLGEWWGAPLLTSSACDKPGVPSNAAANGGPSHFITSACEELELALAFYDWFFQRGEGYADSNYFWQNSGPYPGTELAEQYPDFTGYIIANEEYPGTYKSDAKWLQDNGYMDGNDYIKRKLSLWGNVAIGYRVIDDENGKPVCEGNPGMFVLIDKYMNKGPEAWKELGYEEVVKYTQGMPYRIFNDQYQVASNEEFPALVYFDADTALEVADLQAALNEYYLSETAKFIVGDRDLSELDKYFDELDALGAQDLLAYYANYWEAING